MTKIFKHKQTPNMTLYRVRWYGYKADDKRTSSFQLRNGGKYTIQAKAYTLTAPKPKKDGIERE